ncbi:translation initiation factor IF-2 N-terminal domain-containing protein [Kocuria nitroreducens]|uniref:translation initiation factor IF-2 N-terminal domain-containing protein n=1 Tax=Kocuria nitroreducens TaxID=3058914 RepID=UPI0036DDADBE
MINAKEASKARVNKVGIMRVYELAAELDVDVNDLLSRLKELGEAAIRTSLLDESQMNTLRESFAKPRSQLASRSAFDHVPQQRHRTQESALAPTPAAPRHYGWRAGAVPPPKHPDLLENIEKVKQRFPIFDDHLQALKSLGSQIVYASMCRQEGFKDCAVAHVRFSGAIESGFGFTREVALFYSPHRDLQARTFAAAEKEVSRSYRLVTPDIFFMWSPDQRLTMKLRDWSRPSKLAIPLSINGEDELSLITLLRDYIYARDLFNITTPVHGANFFGRRTLLQSLREDVLNKRVTGLFGLRKSGKTSILMQLMEELEEDGVVTILMDLETFPSPPDDPTDDILGELRRRLISELKARSLRTKELSELPSCPTILELKNALQLILKKLDKDGYQVLLLLDEIEYLTPADRVDIAEDDIPRVAQFLAALRSIVQESENFTFILSGLTSAIVEGGRLYGRPNPLFSWAKVVYVKPFTRLEADDLASTVGGKMGIRIEPGALEALHEASGGHAYLYRHLSSAVVEHLPSDVFQRTMTKTSVLTELEDWRSRVQGNVDEMIEHVKRYYPTEAVMFELLMDTPEDFKELAPSEHVAVRRLKDLGLVEDVDGEYQVSVVLELM